MQLINKLQILDVLYLNYFRILNQIYYLNFKYTKPVDIYDKDSVAKLCEL